MTAEGNWHLVTCEYPPQVGGVSDHSFAVARALAASGRSVHVWCPKADGPAPPIDGVTVHAQLGRMTPSDLRRADRLMNEFPAPRRLLVQWVPHGYGYRSLNLPFAGWVARRATWKGDQLDLVVHEPYLPWSMFPARLAAAAVHRAMLALAALGAARLWIVIPGAEAAVRRYAMRRSPIRWLPVPSPALLVDDPAGVAAVRHALAPKNESLVGHFGTYSPAITGLLAPALERLLDTASVGVALLGRGSDQFAREFLATRPRFSGRVQATGTLATADLSRHLQACDVMLQPYPDGVSSRRTTMVALLAHGRAVVTNEGHLTDAVWRDTLAVELIASRDPAQLASAVVALASDPARRADLGIAALQLHDRVFDIRHTITALTNPDRMPPLIPQEAAAP